MNTTTTATSAGRAAALKAWATRRAGGAAATRRTVKSQPASCLTICGRSRVSAAHLSTASHRDAAERRFREGAAPKGRPGWMIALRADPDDQYAGQWPSYPAASVGPLLADLGF